MKKLLFLLVFITPRLVSAQAFTTGYAGDVQSGMAGAGAAVAIDASSMNVNPASAAFVKGNSISVGGAVAITKTAYVDSNNFELAKTKNPVGTPFHMNAIYGVNDSSSKLSKFKFGLGITTPYGGNVKWDEDWTGRNSIIVKSLKSVAFAPGVTYKINDQLAVGIAVGYSMSSLHVESGLSQVSSDSRVVMDFKSTGWGFGGGVMYKPIPKLTIGLSYISQTNNKSYKGTVKFSTPSAVEDLFPSGKATTKSSVPQGIALGTAYEVLPKLLVALDANYGFWKCFDSTIFIFTDAKSTSALNSVRQPNKYKQQFSLRLGAQYKVTDAITARAGVAYDQTPVPTNFMYPDVPDADRISLTLGGGYVIIPDKLNVDLSYRFVNIFTKGSRNDYTLMSGTYKTYAHIIGLSLNYKF